MEAINAATEALHTATASLEYAIAMGGSTDEALWAAFYAIRYILSTGMSTGIEQADIPRIYDDTHVLAIIAGRLAARNDSSPSSTAARYVHGAALSLIDLIDPA